MLFVDVKLLQMFRYFSEGISILEAEMTSQSHFTLANECFLEHINQNCVFCLWLWKMKSTCYSCPSSLRSCSGIILQQLSRIVHQQLRSCNLSLSPRRSPVCCWPGESSCAGDGCIWPENFASEELLPSSVGRKGYVMNWHGLLVAHFFLQGWLSCQISVSIL